MIDYGSAPKFGRTEGIKTALNMLNQRKPKNAIIVETGTTRGVIGGGLVGDGEATRAWAWYSNKYEGVVHTIDMNPKAIAECKRITENYKDNVVYHTGVANKVIEDLDITIDLLYLDSADDPKVGLGEYEAAASKLIESSIIFIDDTKHDGKGGFYGKGELVYNKLVLEGDWKIAYSQGYQIILIKND